MIHVIQRSVALQFVISGEKESYVITHVSPLGSMDLLSQLEVDMLKEQPAVIFINCFVTVLAVLNSGSLTDSSKELLSKYQDFDINVLRRERGKIRAS